MVWFTSFGGFFGSDRLPINLFLCYNKYMIKFIIWIILIGLIALFVVPESKFEDYPKLIELKYFLKNKATEQFDRVISLFIEKEEIPEALEHFEQRVEERFDEVKEDLKQDLKDSLKESTDKAIDEL